MTSTPQSLVSALHIAEHTVLLALCLEAHARLTFDATPFSLTVFASDLCDFALLLGGADLEAHRPAILTALAAHPSRTIASDQAEEIYTHVAAFQALVRQGVAL